MGQGWLPEPQQDYRPNFLGRVQPYGIYVPTNYNPSRQAWPLTWVLHSYSNGQNEYGARDPNLLHDACEVRDSICATTLGRGPDGWYLDEAELDFWEVWNRISASYRLDADRTVISGYSMGGFGTYRLALGHPDLFARALTLSGAVICGVRVAPGVDLPGTTTHCMRDGDTAPFVPNARWLPLVISRGAVDELVPIGGTTDQVSRFDAAGLRYRDVLWLAEDQ